MSQHHAPHTQPFLRRLEAGALQRIVFYGTSLTSGGAWVPQLLDVLERNYPQQIIAFNTAGAGMHSHWGLDNLDERVLAHKPDVVFLEFSVNDACARFGITEQESRSNLETIITRIRQKRPACDVILQVMNPVLDRAPGHDGHRPHLAQYQEIYRAVGQANQLLVIDHMPAWRQLLATDETTFRTYVPDGLHPQAEGYAHIVVPEILRQLKLAD